MRWLVVLALVASCEDTRRTRDRSSRDLYQLRGELDQMIAADSRLEGAAVAWLGELDAGDRRAAIVWPGLRYGSASEVDAIVYTFERDGRRWRLVDHAAAPSDVSLREMLGGDFEVIRPSGPSVDDLGPAMLAAGKRFRDAVRDHDEREAVAAVESFARGFSQRMLLETDEVFEMLVDDDIDHVRRVEILDVGPGDPATANVVIEICQNSSCNEIKDDTTLVRQGRGWAFDDL